MTAPNKGTITASIERSLRNCSLNHHQSSSSSSNSSDTASAGIIGGPAGFVAAGRSSTSDSTINLDFPDNALELHSDIRLPYYWEQCLDLKSGEVYYINWRTGMKSQEDPRTNPEMQHVRNGGLGLSWSEEEEDEDDSWCESEGSSTEESSPSTSSRQQQCRRRYSNSNSNSSPSGATPRHRHLHLTAETNIHHDKPQVLVVAGCKSCFMYFMLPKQVQDCPKCFGQLLHFDRSEDASP